MRFTFTRDFYVPKGATKVCDKKSDAVAYVSQAGKRFVATIFFGKQAKPVSNYSYKSGTEAADAVVRNFKDRQASLAFKQKMLDDRKAAREDHGWAVGDIAYTSWGYDQTNCEFFQVVEAKGKSVYLRQIGGTCVDATGAMSGRFTPIKNNFLDRSVIDPENKPFRRLASKNGIKIDDVRSAWKQKGNESHYVSWYA